MDRVLHAASHMQLKIHPNTVAPDGKIGANIIVQQICIHRNPFPISSQALSLASGIIIIQNVAEIGSKSERGDQRTFA